MKAYSNGVIPDHVDTKLIRDVDIYNLPSGETDPFGSWEKIKRDSPDIFFTPHYGGYWVINKAEFFAEVLSNSDTFSSEDGVVVPEMPPGSPRFPPLMYDPPNHRMYRHPYNMALSPKQVPELGKRAREVVIERIQRVIKTGGCEFMSDIALHVPVAIVMELFAFPYEDRERLIPMVNVFLHNSNPEERGRAVQGLYVYSAEWVSKRQVEPGKDLISILLKSPVGDRLMNTEEVTSSVTVLLLGGLDSVSHTMGFIMKFLAENPQHRQKLVTNPELIDTAVDELIRRHSISSTVRKLKKNAVLGNVCMKKGDRVLVEMCLHGLDSGAWEDPMEVKFDRCPKNIMSFGAGVHRCVGINLARHEIRALLEEWLKRIPDFSIQPDEEVITLSGQNIGVEKLPLTWPV